MIEFIDSDVMSRNGDKFEEFISSLSSYTVNASNANQKELHDSMFRLNEYIEEVDERQQEGLRKLEELIQSD